MLPGRPAPEATSHNIARGAAGDKLDTLTQGDSERVEKDTGLNSKRLRGLRTEVNR